jgi:N-acetylglucosamine repressor
MAPRQSIDHAAMREKNLALILNTLHENAPMSRVALASKTQLNKATVSSLVQELRSKQLVREIGINPETFDVGRPAINLELNPDAGYIIGAEIGVGYISAIVTDFAAEVKIRRYETTYPDQSQTEILDAFMVLLKDCCDEANREHRQVFGIGIGVPGLVNISEGRLLFAPNLGWSEVALRQTIESELNIPLFLENEANMAALGEYYFGAGQDSDYMLFVSAGVGLGSGIVQNGHLLSGASGLAGEAGHISLVSDGLRCACGSHGCWETLVSERALIRYVEQAVQSGLPAALIASQNESLKGLTTQRIVAEAESGDEVALAAFKQVGFWYGVGLANLINLLNPERVVLGGILSLGHKFMMPVIEQTLRERALRWSLESCELVMATHGPDACMMGGIASVYRSVLSQPTSWT